MSNIIFKRFFAGTRIVMFESFVKFLIRINGVEGFWIIANFTSTLRSFTSSFNIVIGVEGFLAIFVLIIKSFSVESEERMYFGVFFIICNPHLCGIVITL